MHWASLERSLRTFARARNSRNSRPSRCFYCVPTMNAEGEDEGSQFRGRREKQRLAARAAALYTSQLIN